MLVLDENNGQRKRVTTCEYCWTVVLTTLSPAALVECADCARTRLEPLDERLYDWREEHERRTGHPPMSRETWERITGSNYPDPVSLRETAQTNNQDETNTGDEHAENQRDD